MTLPPPIPTSAILLIQQFEGFRAAPYLCPAGIPTLGYGSTHYKDGTRVQLTDPPIDRTQAAELLLWELQRLRPRIAQLITHPLHENQLAALLSFTYNLGTARLQASALRQKINRGQMHAAAEEFPRWVYAGARKLPGLVARRHAERLLFLTPAS